MFKIGNSPGAGQLLLLLFASLFLFAVSVEAATYRVGPDREFKRPSEVSGLVKDGDVIEIDAGEYRRDVTVWRQDNLTLIGVDGRAHLIADGAHAEGKAIWVIKGRNTTVENIEFSGARVPDRNGAGIRQEGTNLRVIKCYFHHNENGILAGGNKDSEILITNSQFAHNGSGDGLTHNIYIGRIAKLTVSKSYIHHARIGHQIKSRARETIIEYNRIMDEETGNSSYIIDVPNGGVAIIVGNLLQQGPMTDNWAMISYGAEGSGSRAGALYVVNNTLVNDRRDGIFVDASRAREPARIMNNIYVGTGTFVKGGAELAANLGNSDMRLLDIRDFDYRLTAESPAVDAGIPVGELDGTTLTPVAQYRHVASADSRPVEGPMDAGAYEFSKDAARRSPDSR